MKKTVLLGPGYSMDWIAETAERAGVRLILPPAAKEVAQAMGLQTLALPSFAEDPKGAGAELDALIDKHGIDAYWPLAASAFDLSHISACPVHAVTIPERFALVNDKAMFAESLGDDPYRPEGVETFGFVRTLIEVRRRLENNEEVIQKPRRGVNGSLYWEVSPNGNLLGNPDMRQILPESYEVELRNHEAVHGPMHWLVMERLHGPELSIDAVCVKGRLLKWMVREKLPSGKQRVMSDHLVIEHVRHLVKTLKLHGIVSIQYMYDRHGNPKILEINLRYSGGCAAYGEPVLGSLGVSGLVTDWLKYMTGMITEDDIQPWKGEATFRVRPVACVE